METEQICKTLDVTWKRATRVWWSYLWRNLIAVIAGFAISFVVSAIFGAILGILGVEVEIIRIIGGVIGFTIGLGISIIPLKMILGKDFGEFRLVLVSYSSDEEVNGGSHP